MSTQRREEYKEPISFTHDVSRFQQRQQQHSGSSVSQSAGTDANVFAIYQVLRLCCIREREREMIVYVGFRSHGWSYV